MWTAHAQDIEVRSVLLETLALLNVAEAQSLHAASLHLFHADTRHLSVHIQYQPPIYDV